MEEKEKTKEELLEEELKRQLNYLAQANVGSKEAAEIIDDIVALSKIHADQEKVKNEADKIQNDKDLEERKLIQAENKADWEDYQRDLDRKEEKKARFWTNLLQGIGIGVTAAIAVLGHIFTNRQLREVLKFESTGEYVTSMAGKSLLGSLFRKR